MSIVVIEMDWRVGTYKDLVLNRLPYARIQIQYKDLGYLDNWIHICKPTHFIKCFTRVHAILSTGSTHLELMMILDTNNPTRSWFG